VKSPVAVLQCKVILSKQAWRDPKCKRTLETIDLESILRDVWQAHWTAAPDRGFLAVTLLADGSPENAALVHPIAERRSGRIGVFDLWYLSPDRVRVTLREEACTHQLGSPRRRTRQIAILQPWKPVRVLLNGRYSSYSGQYYSLLDYYLVLLTESFPLCLQTTRFVDLQADLR
jgi:hypothetical protein